MNQKHMKNDEDAQVGIGTMIVFIATILVAAVAAGVLIDTSQKLQGKATQTGNEATANVGTSLTVQSVMGTVGAGGVDTLNVYVVLSAGADPVDLAQMILQLNDGTTLRVANHAGAASQTEFAATPVRDGDGSAPVMTSGDLFKLTFGTDLNLGNSQAVDLNLVPATGNEISVGFTTPATYGGATEVELF